MLSPIGISLAMGSAFIAGAMNSVAGGGTLVTFPVLLALHISSKVANATSTVALVPGVVAALWGYRKELQGARPWALMIVAPSITGGILGAILLLLTPSRQFDRIVPFLVLGATLLFMGHNLVARLLKTGGSDDSAATPSLSARRIAAYFPFQLACAIYGGYFGAGIGIVMLAALGIMGLKDIHKMNGLKSLGAFCINMSAVLVFASQPLVNWAVAVPMALGAIGGGYAGARLAQRTSQGAVRGIIIAIGLIATFSLLYHTF